MTVVVSDSFNRADNAASLGSADTGQAWTALAGTWGISSNQASASGGSALALLDAGVSDGTAQVTVAVASGDMGLAFRATNANNHLILMRRSGALQLERRISGAFTNLHTFASAPAAAAGQVLTVIFSGSSVTVKVDGVVQDTPVTVTDYQTATHYGLGTGAPGAPRWDDFSVSTAAAPTGINASATCTLALGATATTTVPVAASAAASLNLGCSAQAAVPVTAQGTASLALGMSAQAAVLVQANATATLQLTASAIVGTPPIHASATASLALGMSAQATVAIGAQATGTLHLGVVAQAGVLNQARATATLALSAEASAAVLVSAQAMASLALQASATLFHPGLVLPLNTLRFGALVDTAPHILPGALTDTAFHVTTGPLT